MTPEVQLVECPRDAMQGWQVPISTEQKAAYINQLLQVGFHTLDCLSFVSPKAIPQMADSHAVVRMLDKQISTTKVLAIILNERGATDALQYDIIDILGFPFSISPTFQQKNGNSTIAENEVRLHNILELSQKSGKELVLYISMGFGNPYGDDYSPSMVTDWVGKLQQAGVRMVSLADTVGVASPQLVQQVSKTVINAFPGMQVGVHLHSTASNWQLKLEAALQAGCLRFDGALKGVGGCPMANDQLVGNMNTEWMIPFLEEQGLLSSIDHNALNAAAVLAQEIFQS